MIFSSLLFLFRFLPAVLVLYYLAPRPLRNLVLLLCSLVFYAWGEPVYIILMIVSILVSYTGGILVDRFKTQGKRRAARAALLGSSVVSLSLLGFFKYADFLIGTVDSLTGAGINLLKIALPIGISFYTFQTMSYTIDVYRGEAKVQKKSDFFWCVRDDVPAADRRANCTVQDDRSPASYEKRNGGAVCIWHSPLYDRTWKKGASGK